MAIDAVAIDPDPVIFPYAGLPDVVSERTNNPRAEVSFQMNGDVIPAAGTGDSVKLTVTCNLPIGYGYVLLEAHLGLIASDAVDWDKVAWGQLQNGDAAGTRAWIAPLEFFSRGGSNADGRIIWSLQNRINQLVLGASSNSGPSQFKFVVNNQVLDGAAGTFFGLVRFLQYDVEQAHHVAVNAAVPVR